MCRGHHGAVSTDFLQGFPQCWPKVATGVNACISVSLPFLFPTNSTDYFFQSFLFTTKWWLALCLAAAVHILMLLHSWKPRSNPLGNVVLSQIPNAHSSSSCRTAATSPAKKSAPPGTAFTLGLRGKHDKPVK